ncbi:hypothetical protein QEG73_18295 [Chitinophagaceae bacterium 26-R-25]|nr:hypothetical protein [Chitinophagaceae bacterium 26-R-25]
MDVKYKLFVVYHNQLEEKYYDLSLKDEYYFVNVKPNNSFELKGWELNTINQNELPSFVPLGKEYTESEVIYNVYKSGQLHESLSHIGFLQHDIDSTILSKELLDGLLANHEHINFQPYTFNGDYGQKILMDPRYPNRKTGKGLNCYDAILEDYNNYYQTKHKIEELEGKTINLCSAFILKKDVFISMMQFIETVIASGKLNEFDTERKHRIQGGLLERYYAVWLAFASLRSCEVPLEHLFHETVLQNRFSVKQVIKKILRRE